jgi:hypothetical protein
MKLVILTTAIMVIIVQARVSFIIQEEFDEDDFSEGLHEEDDYHWNWDSKDQCWYNSQNPKLYLDKTAAENAQLVPPVICKFEGKYRVKASIKYTALKCVDEKKKNDSNYITLYHSSLLTFIFVMFIVFVIVQTIILRRVLVCTTY